VALVGRRVEHRRVFSSEHVARAAHFESHAGPRRQVTVALEVRELSFRFEDGTAALSGVSFSITEGSRVALVGPNGAGKSTLLLHISGVLPEDEHDQSEGDVLLFGQRIDATSRSSVRRHVGLLFQDADDQLFCPTVAEDVAFGPTQCGVIPSEVSLRVKRALADVGLAGFEDRSTQALSSGEKKRVALAGLLAYGPRLLVFDEPTSGLDPRARRQLVELCKNLPCTALFATHDLPLVAELCSRTIVLDGGRLVADGPTQALLLDDELMAAHGLEVPRHDLPHGLIAKWTTGES
jgi:cobalt/nickel transport system ATP-binding protein